MKAVSRMIDEGILAAYQRRISPDDVTVRTVPMPEGFHGFVMPDPDDHYNIYLNEKDPYSVRMATLMHELDHIVSGDIWSNESTAVLEHLDA